MGKPPFAELVRRRMREQGLGLREVCRRARLDASFVSKVLSGKRSPPSDEAALRRLADALDVSRTSLIVSAGRIPSEWQGFLQDPAVVESLRRMAGSSWSAPSGAPAPARATGSAKSGLGDELL